MATCTLWAWSFFALLTGTGRVWRFSFCTVVVVEMHFEPARTFNSLTDDQRFDALQKYNKFAILVRFLDFVWGAKQSTGELLAG